MPGIVKFTDVCVANEEDVQKTLEPHNDADVTKASWMIPNIKTFR